MMILGVETSCDDTSVAVVEDGKKVLANVISSQIDIHKAYGGVVPELASRHHLKNIVFVYNEALRRAGAAIDDIDSVAATFGPGLAGSLLVGLNFARSIAYAKKKIFFAVNHIVAHIYANFITHPELTPPFLALIVSGGHTMLINYRNFGDYDVLGTTLDDAVGEAYDKVAKLLGLCYPGGPIIDEIYNHTGEVALQFPRPMKQHKSLDFSFSGLKTAVNIFFKKNKTASIEEIAAAFQQSAIDALMIKLKQAIKQTGAQKVVIGGGVSANSLLRRRVSELGLDYYFPEPILCTDNAAMVASAAFFKRQPDDLFVVDAHPSLQM